MSKKSISFPEFPLVLNSYHDLSGIKESIMESIMSRNAHTLDVRSMNERGKHNLIDARTEKANNEKIMLSKQLEERIDNYLESTRENVINFYNLNINFLKNMIIDSNTNIITRYICSDEMVEINCQDYSIERVLNSLIYASKELNKSLNLNIKCLLNNDIVNKFKDNIITPNYSFYIDGCYRGNVYRALRSGNVESKTKHIPKYECCNHLMKQNKFIKYIYSLLSETNYLFDPKIVKSYLYDLKDFDISTALENYNEIKNVIITTVNLCISAIIEYISHYRNAVIEDCCDDECCTIDGSNICINDTVEESVLDLYDIDMVLEAELGPEYVLVEAFINEEDIVIEGTLYDIKSKAKKIIDSIIKFLKSLKAKIAKFFKKFIKKKNETEKEDESSSSVNKSIVDDEKMVKSPFDEINANSYYNEVTSVIQNIEKKLIEIMEINADEQYSDINEIRNFNSKQYSIDITGILGRLNALVSEKTIPLSEVRKVNDIISKINNIVCNKWHSINKTIDTMIEYNKELSERLNRKQVDQEMISELVAFSVKQQNITKDYMSLITNILNSINTLSDDLNNKVQMESFVSVLDDDFVSILDM